MYLNVTFTARYLLICCVIVTYAANWGVEFSLHLHIVFFFQDLHFPGLDIQQNCSNFSMLFKLILHQNWSIWGQYYRLNIKFYDIPISTQKTLEKKTSCHGYRYTASCHCYHYHYTLRKNGLLHRVSLQVFEKVFRTHSVGHLVIASILFNSNFIKHVRFCRIRFLQIFKSFSSNLL